MEKDFNTFKQEIEQAAQKNVEMHEARNKQQDTEFAQEFDLANKQPNAAQQQSGMQAQAQQQTVNMQPNVNAQDVEFATETDVNQAAQKVAAKNRANKENK